MSGRRVLVCNPGTLHVFHVAAQLDRLGALKECVTSLYFGPGAFRGLPRPLRARALAATANRRCDALAGKVRTHAAPELVHLVAARAGLRDRAGLIAWRNRAFGRWVAQHALEGVDAVWSFDTASLEIFEAARARGIRCILDVSTIHPAAGNRILAQHAALRPEYPPDPGSVVPEAQLARRARELELADRLVAASPFAAESMVAEGVAPAKIALNPYGVDVDRFRRAEPPHARTGPPVFLFVAWFSRHKGVYDLLDAWKEARLWESGARLMMAGGDRAELPRWPGELPPGVQLLGRVAHDDLPRVFASADVFVFPSLFEGFGRVTLEAMAAGLPVITTPTAAAAVVEGENGVLAPAGEIAALAAAMRRLAGDRALRERMGIRSAQLARDHTWDAYGERCVRICEEVLGSPR